MELGCKLYSPTFGGQAIIGQYPMDTFFRNKIYRNLYRRSSI